MIATTEPFTYQEAPDRRLQVFRGSKKTGEIKKVANGWKYLHNGQRHLSTPILKSRTAVQSWLEETNGEFGASK
jgi:hypothetical protein